VTRFFRYPPVREEIAIYDEDRDFTFRPGGFRDVVKVETWGSDHRNHELSCKLRDGLLQEDPRHMETVYKMLEQQLERQMRTGGVWIDG
jgi:hypothetical protein